jgi:hypothetical protein
VLHHGILLLLRGWLFDVHSELASRAEVHTESQIRTTATASPLSCEGALAQSLTRSLQFEP